MGIKQKTKEREKNGGKKINSETERKKTSGANLTFNLSWTKKKDREDSENIEHHYNIAFLNEASLRVKRKHAEKRKQIQLC